MLTDPAEGKGKEKKNPTPNQLEDVDRCLPTFIFAYCDNACAIRTSQAGDGNGGEGVLGNKQERITGGWLNMKDNRFRMVISPKLPMQFLF